MWTAIVLITAACCLIIYTEQNGHKGSKSSSGTIAPSEIPRELTTLPNTLPIVAPTQRATKKAQEPTKSAKTLKSNYIEPIGVAEKTQVDDGDYSTEEAEQAQYDFPEEMYPYRTFLTEEQKKAYDAIYSAEMAKLGTCNVAAYMLSEDALDDVVKAVHNDHPELFWVDTSQYKYVQSKSGRIVVVNLQFNQAAADFESTRENFQRETKKIISGASKLATDEEKAKYVHDAITGSVIYDESALLNQSAYSAAVNKASVCAGYSRLFQYVMQQLDIPCYYCTGYGNNGSSNTGHAWNIMKIDGKFYNVDVTWDDSLGEEQGKNVYTYYKKTDSSFAVSHTRRGLSVRLPNCE